jgi:recombinational DNA repair protein (RecF pathway)
LVTFSEGVLTIYHRERRELQTFREFGATRARTSLATDPVRLAGASVLGELVLANAGEEENPGLYYLLSSGLDAVDGEGKESLLPRILAELWGLVGELGYEPSLEACVRCERPLSGGEMSRFDFSAGGVHCMNCGAETKGPRLGPRAREQLLTLLHREVPQQLLRPRAHLRLASDFITYHISGGTPLRSVEVLASLLADTHA